MDRCQFSLRGVFLVLTALSVLLASVMRPTIAFVSIGMIAWCGMVAVLGWAMGGFFRHRWLGAIIGTVAFQIVAAALLVLSLMHHLIGSTSSAHRMPDTTPSRRFRFGLRTLFAVVTIVCAGLGYISHEWRIVQEREQVLEMLLSDQNRFLLIRAMEVDRDGNPVDRRTWIRRLLNDPTGWHGWCFPMDAVAERERFIRAFPECESAWYEEYTGNVADTSPPPTPD